MGVEKKRTKQIVYTCMHKIHVTVEFQFISDEDELTIWMHYIYIDA